VARLGKQKKTLVSKANLSPLLLKKEKKEKKKNQKEKKKKKETLIY
jgi:hypothetical protein